MNIAIITQARLGSTRLPGKVLKKVIHKSLLDYHIERLLNVERANQVIIATTTHEHDAVLLKEAKRLGVKSYAGSENDVLSRFYEAATEFKADVIVRVTSDCPIIDPEVIDFLIAFYLNHKDEFDYVSNTLDRTYPRGLDAEIFSYECLKKAHLNATDLAQREHVTPYFYQNPQLFKVGQFKNDTNLSHHRWTVDTPEDFELIERILSTLYPMKPGFSYDDVISLLKKTPEWIQINSHIEQKTLGK